MIWRGLRDLQIHFPTCQIRWWQSLSSLPCCSGDLGWHATCRNLWPTTKKMRCSRPKCRQWRPERELQRQVAFEVHKENQIRRIPMEKIHKKEWIWWYCTGCRNFKCEWFRSGSFVGLNWSRTLCPSKMAFKNWSAVPSGSEGTGRLAPCVFPGGRRCWDVKSSARMSAYIDDLHHICQFFYSMQLQRLQMSCKGKESELPWKRLRWSAVFGKSLSFLHISMFFCPAMSIRVNTMSGWHHSQALSWKSEGRNPSMCCMAIIFFDNAVEAQKVAHIPCGFSQHRHRLQHGDSISWHFSWGSGGGASGWRQLFKILLLAYILSLICELCSKWSNPANGIKIQLLDEKLHLDTICKAANDSFAAVPHSWARSDELCTIVKQEQTSSDRPLRKGQNRSIQAHRS